MTFDLSQCFRFALNGVSIYNSVDATGKDAYEQEGDSMNGCGAHADPQNR